MPRTTGPATSITDVDAVAFLNQIIKKSIINTRMKSSNEKRKGHDTLPTTQCVYAKTYHPFSLSSSSSTITHLNGHFFQTTKLSRVAFRLRCQKVNKFNKINWIDLLHTIHKQQEPIYVLRIYRHHHIITYCAMLWLSSSYHNMRVLSQSSAYYICWWNNWI